LHGLALHHTVFVRLRPPRTPLGELTAPPDTLSGGEGAGCPSQEPHFPFGPSSLRLRSFGPC